MHYIKKIIFLFYGLFAIIFITQFAVEVGELCRAPVDKLGHLGWREAHPIFYPIVLCGGVLGCGVLLLIPILIVHSLFKTE